MCFTKDAKNYVPAKKPRQTVVGGSEIEKRSAENLIRWAMRENRFEVYYQPLYNVHKEQFTEAEALLRLKDPSGKFVPPDEFIPAAEQTGLIVEIGRMVLWKTCCALRLLLARGVEIEAVSVNLSVVQLQREDSAEKLLRIIQEGGVSPDRIVFEVTESTIIHDYPLIAKRIRELGAAGIRFALDDFGTGYSSIAHVSDLPFDSVKIDKSLIWGSARNRKCSILTEDLAQMFRHIRLDITAEGVETEEQDRFARRCGFDKIQGFRYARPMPMDQAAALFGRRAV